MRRMIECDVLLRGDRPIRELGMIGFKTVKIRLVTALTLRVRHGFEILDAFVFPMAGAARNFVAGRHWRHLETRNKGRVLKRALLFQFSGCDVVRIQRKRFVHRCLVTFEAQLRLSLLIGCTRKRMSNPTESRTRRSGMTSRTSIGTLAGQKLSVTRMERSRCEKLFTVRR